METKEQTTDDATSMTDHEALEAMANEDRPEDDPNAPTPGRAPAEIETAIVVRGMLEPTALILAPNWNLQEAELDALASAYADVLDKYVPDGVGNMPEVVAAMLTVGVFLPRLRSGIPPRGDIEAPDAKPEQQASEAKKAATNATAE